MSDNQITGAPEKVVMNVDAVAAEASVGDITTSSDSCQTCGGVGYIIHGGRVPCPECKPEQAHFSGPDAWQHKYEEPE